MQFSIINYSEAVKHNRFGAEYWKPDYLEPLKLNCNWVPIGSALSKCQYGLSRQMNENNIGEPIYRMNEMESVFLSNPMKSVVVDSDELKEFRLKKDDILFNRTNSFNFVGRTGILKHEVEAVFASYLIRLNTIASQLLPEYLTIYLNSKLGVGQVRRRAMESINQTNVSGSEIKKVPIPLLKMDFQSLIKLLVDNSAQLRVNSISLFEQSQSILLNCISLANYQFPQKLSFIKYFSDTEISERFDAEYFQPKYDELVSQVKNYSDGYDLFENLVNVIDENFTPESNTSYKYIELANIGNNGEITGFTEAVGSELPTRARRKVSSNDIIVSSIEGSLESIALIEDSLDGALCSTGFYVINSDYYNSGTLLILLKSIVGQLQLKKGCSGTILTAINKGELSKIILPKIGQEIQEEIKSKISEMYESRGKSKALIEIAKRSVEMAIEQDETTAENWMNEEVVKLGVELNER